MESLIIHYLFIILENVILLKHLTPIVKSHISHVDGRPSSKLQYNVIAKSSTHKNVGFWQFANKSIHKMFVFYDTLT